MPSEGKDTPKICLGVAATLDEASMRRVKQIGVDYVLTGGPKIPWAETDIRSRIDQFRAAGLTLCNMMISGFDDVIWGRPGGDAQIADVITSIRAAGKAGLPVIEYNFYAHRLVEGYKEESGRAGAGYSRLRPTRAAPRLCGRRSPPTPAAYGRCPWLLRLPPRQRLAAGESSAYRLL